MNTIISMNATTFWNYFFESRKLKLSKEEKLSLVASTLLEEEMFEDLKTIIFLELLCKLI